MEQKWLKEIPLEKGWYLAGFVDGEGSFNISFAKKNDYRSGWQVTPSFNVSQKDETILFLLKKYLGCGRIKRRKDGLWIFVVENPHSLKERVIPFFKKYRFFSSKAKTNFSIFCQIVDLINKDKHLTEKGLEKIARFRERINEGHKRKRKYNLSDIKASKDNPQRLYAEPSEK